jgi:hypothetical protein
LIRKTDSSRLINDYLRIRPSSLPHSSPYDISNNYHFKKFLKFISP